MVICRPVGDNNQHWRLEAHTHYPQSVNISAGIVCDRILRPLFIYEALAVPDIWNC